MLKYNLQVFLHASDKMRAATMPQKNVITGTTASASLEPLCIFIPRSADPTNAAGAASTPKMNCGDVENNANKNDRKYRPI